MTDYRIEYQPLAGALEKLDVQAVIDGVTDPWFNQTLCEVDGAAVRLGVSEWMLAMRRPTPIHAVEIVHTVA
jgi:hypothetical protein